MTTHDRPLARAAALAPAALCLLCLHIPAAADLRAQHDPLRFRHLTIEDGLSQNAVSDLVQDRRGFLWVGTKDGLNRYDGYEFVAYHHDPFDPLTLSDSDVTALYEDRDGRLWVGTRAGGLHRLDRETSTFEHYPAGPRGRITAITGDGAGTLWIGTESQGLYRFRPATGRFTHFRHDPGRPGSLGDDRVHALLVDRRGVLWVATAGGLNRLDPADGAGAAPAAGGAPDGFVRYPRRPDVPLGMIDSATTALHEDGAGRLWVGSTPGISVLAPDRDSVRHYYHRYRDYRYGWGLVRDILADRDGHLWISTHAELMRFDPVAERFSYHRRDPLDRRGINSDQPTALLQDRSGVMWVGTNGSGLNVHDPKASRFHTVRRQDRADSRMSRFSVYSLFEDSGGRVWVGAGVLYRWDRRTGELKSFETTSTRPDDFGNHAVWSVLEAPRGSLWVGSDRGLYHHHIATGTTRHYRHDPADSAGVPEVDVRKVFRSRDGTLWIVTPNYLARLEDPEAGRFRSFRYTLGPSTGEWTFPALHEDARGALWLGSHQGLARFDPATGAFRRFRSNRADPGSLGHDVVRSLQPDPRRPDAVLWVGTAGGGLNRLDLRTGTFERLTVSDGLPNNVIYGILPDDDGRLWLSTNRGLSRFDPATREFRNYDASDGLQSNEFNSGAYFRSPGGELFFGGIHGFNHFYPGQVRDNPNPPEVVITAFRRGNRYETVRDTGSVLDAAITEVDRIELGPRDRVVGFTFAALDFSAPEKNRYAYRLLGFSREWSAADDSRSATYTHLPSGSYTFQVKASNNDGVWNEAGASIGLVVVPPWWRTPWAYATLALLVLATLYAIRRYELGRARLRNRLEVERVEAAKLRELDRSKTRFFADVSHEIRTPLTLTLGPLDDLLDGLHGPLHPEAREQVGLARRSAARVLDLINQIMELERLEAGRTEFRPRPLDLVALVADTVSPFRPHAARRTMRLDLDVPADTVPLHADPDHLKKVFGNLLSNALKFTPEGGAVRVVVEAEGDTARVLVRDSGPGIPEADRERVFDRFHRADGATLSQSGTGIGLALAKELVDLHRGSLTLHSEEGFGTTFIVELPRVPGTTITDAVTAGVGPSPDPSLRHRNDRHDT